MPRDKPKTQEERVKKINEESLFRSPDLTWEPTTFGERLKLPRQIDSTGCVFILVRDKISRHQFRPVNLLLSHQVYRQDLIKMLKGEHSLVFAPVEEIAVAPYVPNFLNIHPTVSTVIHKP